MHEALDLNRQIQAAQARLQQIEQQAATAEPASLTVMAMAELAAALDELQATATELHQQNRALLTNQQALLTERQRYQNLFNFAPDAYLITDGQGTICAVNSAAERLLNLHPNYAVGKPLTVFVAEADHAFFFAQLEQINAAPPPAAQASEPAGLFTLFLQGREVWLTPRRQPDLPVSLSVSGEWDQQGKITQLYWIFHDLRARKQAEVTLRESEAKYRSLFNEMTEAYSVAEIIVNDDGEPVDYRMLEVNPQFERLTGLSRELVLGGTSMHTIAPDLDGEWHQLYGQVALTGEPIRFERQVNRWGRWFDVHAFRIGDPKDHHVAILFEDVSDRKQLALALQTSEAQLSQILDSAIAVIISFRVFENGDWEYNYFSSGCESILGYSPQAFLADKQLWRSRMHPDDLATLDQLFADLFAERSAVWEYRFRHRDGSLRWLSSTYTSQKMAEGCWQVTVVGHDITERQQAEASLRESEAKYRSLFDEIDEGYGIAEIIVNERNEPVDYRMVEVNPRFEELTGLPRDLVLSGRTVRDIAPEIEDYWHQIYGQVAITGTPTRFEQKVDDWGRWYDVYAFPVGDPALRRVGILFNDISERKRAEADLQASERKLRAAFNGTFAFMGLLTPEGTLIDANRTALDAIAADLDAVVGQPFWQTPWWAHFPEQQQQLAAFTRRAASGETIRAETQHVWADGTAAWLDFSLKPIVDAAGQVVMLMPEGRDITDRKQAELTLQQQVKQEYLLNNITEDIRRSLDLEAVLVRAVERSRAVLDSDRVIVFRFVSGGEGQVIAESVGNGFKPILGSTIHDPCFSDRYVEAYRQG
ncbi:MAG TPA: PAS domain S-box protein, partial [Nodosilinea sp.]|nr:PAS domain S-box protein [Nodosilinea sp.]